MEPSQAEQTVIKRVRRAKLFVFLRQHRHELFDEEFQAELARLYADRPKGRPPVPPAQLALATILQVVEATLMDWRWQLALDCLDAEHPPFAKGTLVEFRKWLIAAGCRPAAGRAERAAGRADHRGFRGHGVAGGVGLQPAVGRGPGRGHLYSLMGHALRKALGVLAAGQGQGLADGVADLAGKAGTPMLAASSLKAAPAWIRSPQPLVSIRPSV